MKFPIQIQILIALLCSTVSASLSHAQKTPPEAVQEVIVNPTIKSESPPVYPPLALEKRMEATVVLDLEIAADGTMDSVSIKTIALTNEAGEEQAIPEGTPDGDFGFAQAALIAGNQLEFHPATVNGEPVAVAVSYTYRFQLPAAPPEVVPDIAAPTKAPEETPAVLNFSGELVERGTRSLVAGAKITVYRGEGDDAEGFEASTDAQGRFGFYDLSPGTWTIVAERDGYIRFETTETIVAEVGLTAKYYFERGSYNRYDITVTAERPKKEVSRRSLSGAAIEKIPGTLGDPVLVIENLPGVARSSFGGEIIVRGSGPNDTIINVDGVRVPLIFHFGAIKSVFPANIIESIDFYPGNFSAAYGRGMGGVFDLHVKRLEPDRIHGSIDVSLLDTSLYLEVPITDTLAFGVAGRRSYVDIILNAVLSNIDSISSIQAPRYYDYQFFGSWRPAPAHDIRWLMFGSDDIFELLFQDPAEFSGEATSNGVSLGTAFQRITADYRYTPNAKLKNHLKVAAGRDLVNFDILGLVGAQFNLKTINARDTLSYRLSKHVNLDVGIDLDFYNSTGKIVSPPPPREGENMDFDPDAVLTAAFDGQNNLFAATFVEADINVGRFTIVPGLRLDYFGLSDDWSVDPRLVARYDADQWTAKGGVAVVHQSPDFPDIDPIFGNPDLGLQRAYQYSIGGEWRPLEHINIDLTLFYKDMRDLVAASNKTVTRMGMELPEKLGNVGRGRVYGAEVFAEHQFANNMRGWISYTLSRGERKDQGDTEYRLFDYDQTHIFTIVGSYILPKNWEVGLRWRFVTGSLNTPVIGSVFNNEQDEYKAIYGATNSARGSAFHQLDLRVDKSWAFEAWQISTYLSLTNAYNRGNAAGLNYNYDYSQQSETTGLPILPILGVKGEW